MKDHESAGQGAPSESGLDPKATPWWTRALLRAAQRMPRLGGRMQKVGALLLIAWPVVMAFLVLPLLAHGLPAGVERWLDEQAQRHPILALTAGLAIVLLLLHAVSAGIYRLNFLGRQVDSLTEANRSRAPDDRPVVYLRPFSADATHRVRFRDRLAVVGANVLSSVEEQLAQVVLPIGPLVAIGAPSETLPTPGATRSYASDDDWKSLVGGWLNKARLVILRPGLTEGVRWELEEVLARVPPERVLILLLDVRQRDYTAVAAALRERTPVRLPEFAALARRRRVSGLFEFDPHWQAAFLPLKAPWLRDSPWAPTKAPLHHALRPVFDRLGVPWQPAPLSRWKLFQMALVPLAMLLLVAASRMQ